MGKYKEQLDRLRQQRYFNSALANSDLIDKDSISYKLDQQHKEMYNRFLDNEIDKTYKLYIREVIQEELSKINYTVDVDGEKITDAVIKHLTKGL